MLFNSFQFAVFFPVVTILYFLLPHKFRWLLLLAASAYFYMAFVPAYILILLVTITVDYFVGIWLEKTSLPQRKKWLLIASLIANVGFLGFFKYFNFFNSNITYLADLIHWNYPISNLKIILPIGLSFHTFQAMSYTIEVYRGRQQPERNFGIFALYVLFYPQLVAGPIERPQNMLHQFHTEHHFDYQRITNGLKIMVWGFFKKAVVADSVAQIVSTYYSTPEKANGPVLALATALFAIQIYCDFSGYSEIALGAAQVMGFKLMVNFRRPYLALSISEFWQRWHISLSTWFRDYLYIPLGGNRVSRLRWYGNLMLVFLVSGLWHGANWTFVIWGGLHGLYLVIENMVAPFFQKVLPIKTNSLAELGVIIVRRIWVLLLVGFAWIFFRAETTSKAILIAKILFKGWFDKKSYSMLSGIFTTDFMVTLFFILVLAIIEIIQEKGNFGSRLARLHPALKWSLYVGSIVIILVFGQIYAAPTEFIYFQF